MLPYLPPDKQPNPEQTMASLKLKTMAPVDDSFWTPILQYPIQSNFQQ